MNTDNDTIQSHIMELCKQAYDLGYAAAHKETKQRVFKAAFVDVREAPTFRQMRDENKKLKELVERLLRG